MEPFSALAVATSVVQFLDFSAKVISKGNQLRKSVTGALSENDEIEGLASRLQDLVKELRTSTSSSQAQGDQALQIIYGHSVKVADELVAELRKLKVPTGSRNRRWKSFRHALKTVWSKEKLEAMVKKLNGLQQELSSHLIIMLR